MEYTYQKGLKISKMSLGTVQLGLSYGINNTNGLPDDKESCDILQAAVNGGVTVFDTASTYGRSEQIIGEFLKKGAQKPVVVTKAVVNPNPLEGTAKSDVYNILYAQITHSLELLGLKSLPILMLHRENELIDYAEVLPYVLQRLKNEGLIERAGASLNSHSLINHVLNHDIYEAVQLPLNMMDSALIKEGKIESLHTAGKIVFIRSVFLQGLFFKDPESLPGGILQGAKKPLQSIRELAQETKMSIAQLAVGFIRDLQGVSSLVLGCETPWQVLQNLELVNAPPLSEKIKAQMLDMFDDVDPRVIMPWTWERETV